MNARIGTLASILFSLAGASQANEPESFDYRAITRADLDRVREDWAGRDLSAKNVLVIHEEKREDFTLMIVRHDVGKRAHFGAIFVPNIEDLQSAPVIVLPDGLEQHNPIFDVELKIRMHQEYAPRKIYEPLDTLKGFVQIIPAFRGRFTSYEDNGWFSRGDFCDAYDGAADDTIALLNAAQQLLTDVSFENVLLWGGSRGGNTALLMAARDPRVTTVIAAAAPVDFYRKSWQFDDSNQYRCQFFDGKTEQESRQRMLASSPLFYEPNANLEHVFLHHDEGDDIVPLWNAQEIATHLESHSVDVTLFEYPTEAHGAMLGDESFWLNLQFGITSYQRNLTN